MPFKLFKNSKGALNLPTEDSSRVKTEVVPLVDDIWFGIFDFLPSLDLFGLLFVCQHLHDLLPHLYQRVTLKSYKSASTTLSNLLHKPYLASYIKELRVQPLLWPIKETAFTEEESEEEIVKHLKELTPYLENLQVFVLETVALPKDASLWEDLRTRSPYLTEIGISLYKDDTPLPLLQFASTLTALSVSVNWYDAANELIPTYFHDLIGSCIRLQSLTIKCRQEWGPSFRRELPFRLCHFPGLRSISLDRFYDADSLTDFIMRHPGLKTISLPPNMYFSHHDPNIGSMFPNVTEYSGPIDSVVHIPEAQRGSIKRLQVYANHPPYHISRSSKLMLFPNITYLAIFLPAPPNKRYYGNDYYAAISSLKHLKDFEITLQQDEFAKINQTWYQIIPDVLPLDGLESFSLILQTSSHFLRASDMKNAYDYDSGFGQEMIYVMENLQRPPKSFLFKLTGYEYPFQEPSLQSVLCELVGDGEVAVYERCRFFRFPSADDPDQTHVIKICKSYRRHFAITPQATSRK